MHTNGTWLYLLASRHALLPEQCGWGPKVTPIAAKWQSPDVVPIQNVWKILDDSRFVRASRVRAVSVTPAWSIFTSLQWLNIGSPSRDQMTWNPFVEKNIQFRSQTLPQTPKAWVGSSTAPEMNQRQVTCSHIDGTLAIHTGRASRFALMLLAMLWNKVRMCSIFCEQHLWASPRPVWRAQGFHWI